MLIVIGAFLIINGLPEGHEWYEETFVHEGWNEIVERTPIPSEFGMDEHEHEHRDANIAKEIIPLILLCLIGGVVIWYILKTRNKEQVAV